MSAAPALYQRHHKLAAQFARDFWVPGMEREDVRQEARLALWEACRSHDPTKGKFPPFARVVIRNHLTDLLRVTSKRGNAPVPVPLTDVAAPEAQLSLLAVVDALPSLTAAERRAVTDSLNGVPARSSKAHETALYRARRKLREAA